MITDCYTLIKDQEDRFYFIPESEIVYGAPLHDTCNVNESGDYTLMNSDSCCSADFCRAGSVEFGNSFMDLEWNFNEDGSIILENLEELGLKEKEEEIYNFVSSWREENESIAYCDYYSFWNGHENKYIIFSCDTPDLCTDDYEVLDDYEAAPILKAFGQVSEWEEESAGIRVAYYGGYKFVDSCWDGHVGSYEGRLLDDDERINLAESAMELERIEATSGCGGSPKNTDWALIGFNDFDDAKKIADRFGLRLSVFMKKESWQLWERMGVRPDSEMQITDLGIDGDCSLFGPNDAEDFYEYKIKTRICDAENLEQYNEIVESAQKVLSAIDELKYNEKVVVRGVGLVEVVKTSAMRKTVDNKTYVIGVEAEHE